MRDGINRKWCRRPHRGGRQGRIRDYNITKKEWVLDGATVLYGSATELRATLDYDFSEEKKFSYRNLSMDEIIHHLAVFISRLWQIHVFGEGNTRTTTEFQELFLRNLLLNEHHPLRNRTLHINSAFKKTEKPDIENLKLDIEKMFQMKTLSHILKLCKAFPGQAIFGRSDVMGVIDIKPTYK